MPLVLPATGKPLTKRGQGVQKDHSLVIIQQEITLKWMQLCLPVL